MATREPPSSHPWVARGLLYLMPHRTMMMKPIADGGEQRRKGSRLTPLRQ